MQGSLNLLEVLKPVEHSCAVVMVTTDKVYANQEWDYGNREADRRPSLRSKCRGGSRIALSGACA